MYVKLIVFKNVNVKVLYKKKKKYRLISEAKQGRAWLILGWETSWE